jgi:hypothetical protein
MPTATDLAAVIQQEQDAMAMETRILKFFPLVAVNQIEDAAKLPSQLRYSHPATVRQLDEASGTAYVVACESLQSTVFWAATDNDTYRRDYLLYLNQTYQLDLEHIPRAYDVDHLYNRSRAQMYGLRFIRMALVGRSANRSHGGAYEKDLTVNEASRVRKDMKLMDAISAMKYHGFLSPLRDDPRDSEIAAYAAFAASRLGISAAEIRTDIEYLREKASTPWAR